MTDLQQIYQAVLQNNVDTLYVQQGYMQTGWVDTDQQRIYLDKAHAPDSAQATDDVINHIIDASTATRCQYRIYYLPDFTVQSTTDFNESLCGTKTRVPFDCDRKNSHADLSTWLFQSRFKLLIHTQIYAFS